jgi:hypothetical protein
MKTNYIFYNLETINKFNCFIINNKLNGFFDIYSVIKEIINKNRMFPLTINYFRNVVILDNVTIDTIDILEYY